MNYIKKLQFKVIASYLIIGLMAIFAVGVVTYAYVGQAPMYVIEGDFIEAPKAVEAPEEETEFGHSTVMTKWFNHAGHIEYVENGSFRDNTTTLLSFINPFGEATSTDQRFLAAADQDRINKDATSSVEFIALNITSPATTTYSIQCGGSSNGYGETITHVLLQTNAQTTANVGSTTVGLIMNNSSSTDPASGIAIGQGVINGSNTSKIFLTKDYPYFVCKATTETANIGAFTQDGVNTFDGTYTVKISKPQ